MFGSGPRGGLRGLKAHVAGSVVTKLANLSVRYQCGCKGDGNFLETFHEKLSWEILLISQIGNFPLELWKFMGIN